MTLSYNPYAPDFYVDPRPVYKRLRDEAPAFWSEPCQMWALSRYDDVRNALRNWQVFSSAQGALGASSKFFEEFPLLLNFDPPRHTQLRKVLSSQITPDRMLALKDSIRERTIALLQPFEGTDRMDLTQDFAALLPLQIIADLLGIPQQDALMLSHIVDRMSDFSAPNPEQASGEGVRLICDYYIDYFHERAKRPAGDDIVWHLMEAAKAGVLTHNEAVGFAMLVTIAGSETTTKMIGNAAWQFNCNPAQRRLLIQQPDLLPNALEEALRFDSSTHMLARILTGDIEIHGQKMRAGESVALLFNAANNDERKFADPDRFDISRSGASDHIAFGGGLHACLGSPLARLELRIAFEEIFKRWPNFEIDTDAAVRYVSPFVKGFRELPIQLLR